MQRLAFNSIFDQQLSECQRRDDVASSTSPREYGEYGGSSRDVRRGSHALAQVYDTRRLGLLHVARNVEQQTNRSHSHEQ
jgi:hypothetical protein